MTDALSAKEAELVKPPREYGVSGDAVGGIPAGMVAVPVEPTEAMRTAAAVATNGWRFGQGVSINDSIDAAWSAMLAAAPAYTPKARPTASDGEARERIARIIDPVPFDAGDNSISAPNDRRVLLAKADAILAALNSHQ